MKEEIKIENIQEVDTFPYTTKNKLLFSKICHIHQFQGLGNILLRLKNFRMGTFSILYPSR
jgi:hypothetical protein